MGWGCLRVNLKYLRGVGLVALYAWNWWRGHCGDKSSVAAAKAVGFFFFLKMDIFREDKKGRRKRKEGKNEEKEGKRSKRRRRRERRGERRGGEAVKDVGIPF